MNGIPDLEGLAREVRKANEWLSHDRWCECSAGITPCGKSQATNAI